MRLLGIFGHPISHSLSPDMHQAALAACGLQKEFVYLPFDVAPHDLENAVKAIRALNAKGVNVTIPHKESVIPFLDEMDPQAALVGAVNVIVNDEGKLVGYNTDGIGFIRSLKEEAGILPNGKKILLLGAGGAARAVGAALASAGAEEILIVNRSLDRAQSVADMVKKSGTASVPLSFCPETLKEVISKVHIIVNTTSVGLYPAGESLLTGCQEYLHQEQLVCDIIYNPRETLLLKEAKSRGCRTLSGMGMLLYQGVEAFRLWTGAEAPVEVMKNVLEERLGI